jgi:hypothetical protein
MNDLFEFDPGRQVWSRLSDTVVAGLAPSERSSFGFASDGSRLFVFGGINPQGAPTAVSACVPKSSITASPSILEGSQLLRACKSHLDALSVNFCRLFSGTLGDLIEFDPALRRWTTLISNPPVSTNNQGSPMARESLAMAVSSSRIFIFGGTQGVVPDSVSFQCRLI